MGGNAGTRMAWGMVQEAAAAHCLLDIFPGCSIEEVGLFQVDADTQVPGNWAAATGQLPAMGASPDALITHTLQLTTADMLEASALLNGGGSSSGGSSSSSGSSTSNSTSDITTVQHGGQSSSGASAAARLLLTRGLSRVAAIGSSGPSAAVSGQAGAIKCDLSSSTVGSLASPAVEKMLLEQLQQWQEANSNIGSVATSSSGSSSAGSEGLQGDSSSCTTSFAVREVVEVKNHCPFVFRHRYADVAAMLPQSVAGCHSTLARVCNAACRADAAHNTCPWSCPKYVRS